MNTIVIVGALLCWKAPLPSITERTLVRVEVMELKPLPANVQPGAWVRAVGGRLAGVQWHVDAQDLAECKAPAKLAER